MPSTNPILTLLLQTNLSGRWTNELGSKVELEFHKDGRVSGKYHTAVGDDHTWEPVHGMINLLSAASLLSSCLTLHSYRLICQGSDRRSICDWVCSELDKGTTRRTYVSHSLVGEGPSAREQTRHPSDLDSNGNEFSGLGKYISWPKHFCIHERGTQAS